MQWLCFFLWGGGGGLLRKLAVCQGSNYTCTLGYIVSRYIAASRRVHCLTLISFEKMGKFGTPLDKDVAVLNLALENENLIILQRVASASHHSLKLCPSDTSTVTCTVRVMMCFWLLSSSSSIQGPGFLREADTRVVFPLPLGMM